MAPETANRQSDSKYTGVYKRGINHYCELQLSGSGKKRVKYYARYSSHELASLASDVVRFFTRPPGSFRFNLPWSASAIVTNCAARSDYESLLDWAEKKRFVKRETDALISSYTKFKSGISQVLSPAHPEVLSPAHHAQVPSPERHGIVSHQPMPGDKAHKDKDMLVVDEMLSSMELLREELLPKLTIEEDFAFEYDNWWLQSDDASSPTSASHEVPPQVLHGSNIPLDDPPSHRKLDMNLPTARGEIVLRQDGACSANEERDQGVWEMHQDIKQMQLDFMHGLRRSMDKCKNTIPMQPSQLQKLNQHMHDLNGIISFMELPRAELPPELSLEKLSASLTSMMEFHVDTAKWLSGIYPANPAG